MSLMYSYRGNQFRLKEEPGFWRSSPLKYRIIDMEIHADEVWLPDLVDGKIVHEWEIRKETGVIRGVRVLHIPRTIDRISIRNDLFPDLERVEVESENPVYYTDGRFLMAYDSTSRKYPYACIVYCPVCNGDEVQIPDKIKKICNYAFSGTRYHRIQFPKAEPEIEPYAFEGSQWLREQEFPVVIGSLLYQIKEGTECLEVPTQVRRIVPEIFDGNYIREMALPFLPTRSLITRINEMGSLRSLAITSAEADINIRLLQKFETLEEVVIAEEHSSCQRPEKVAAGEEHPSCQTLEKTAIAEGHPRYQTRDGVMFSADGNSLVYYPPFKKDVRYVIPDGVSKIGESAFVRQRYLEELVMPDSVRSIGPGAFRECESLSRVQFSPNIRQLPDSTPYQKGGVFEGCQNLEEVKLPERLRYLGSYAFYRSGLRRITLNEQLEQIAEYALMAENLTRISMPESVRWLGKGALFYAAQVEAYEGTAHGLVSALNAVRPDEKDESASLNWKRRDVTVLHRCSKKTVVNHTFLIPASLTRSAAYHLDMAWNQDTVDYAEYDVCLSDIADAQEKMEFVRSVLMRCEPGEENPCSDYTRRMSYKIAEGMLEEHREEEFLHFLKMDYLSAESIEKLVKLSNRLGMTVCTAYLLENRQSAHPETQA